MDAKRAGVLAWTLCGLVLLAWGLAKFYDPGSEEVIDAASHVWAVSFLAFPVVGALLARRLPLNPVGWLFLIGPLLVGSGVALTEASENLDNVSLGVVGDLVLPAGLLALCASVVLFPDGRYPRPWFGILHAASVTAFLVDPDSALPAIANLVLPLVALVYRLVRGDAVTRRQIGWPVFVAIVSAVVILAVYMFSPTGWGDLLGSLLTPLLTVGIPVAIAISILKYRLYDFDRIVSRTVGYALVLGLLGVVYATGAVWLPARIVGEQPPLFVAGSTLAAAALFNPVRRRVLRWVDRRFHRTSYDPERIAHGFSARLRNEIDPERLTDEWLRVVTETMRPMAVGVWVRQ